MNLNSEFVLETTFTLRFLVSPKMIQNLEIAKKDLKNKSYELPKIDLKIFEIWKKHWVQ